MNGFNKLLYQMSQIHYTQYPKSVIPNIPNLLYHLFQIRYTTYPKTIIPNTLNMRITK